MLKQRHFGSLHVDLAVQCTDHAAGRRSAQLAQVIADGDDVLADGEHVGIAECGGRQARGLDLDNGKIVALVRADQRRVILRVIIKRDLNGGSAVNDMVAGDDVSVARDDDAAARARRLLRGAVAEVEAPAKVVAGIRVRDRDVNADDRGSGDLDDLCFCISGAGSVLQQRTPL